MRRLFARANVTVTSVRCFISLPSLVKPKGQPAELPKLDFDYSEGCPPTLSPRQVELHYTKHHKAYVDKLNTLAKEKFDGKAIEEIMSTAAAKSERVLFNQAAQHFNHSFYWKCIFPNGKKMPKEVENELIQAFGSVDAFQKLFEESGAANFGSGWTWLVYCPQQKGLLILNSTNAETPLYKGFRPLLTVDVWEHAYYKDFENKRADYLNGMWKIINWEFVGQQLAAARKK